MLALTILTLALICGITCIVYFRYPPPIPSFSFRGHVVDYLADKPEATVLEVGPGFTPILSSLPNTGYALDLNPIAYAWSRLLYGGAKHTYLFGRFTLDSLSKCNPSCIVVYGDQWLLSELQAIIKQWGKPVTLISHIARAECICSKQYTHALGNTYVYRLNSTFN